MVVFGKMVAFEQMCFFPGKGLYSGKVLIAWQDWLNSCKVNVIGQKWLSSCKVVVFMQSGSI